MAHGLLGILKTRDGPVFAPILVAADPAGPGHPELALRSSQPPGPQAPCQSSESELQPPEPMRFMSGTGPGDSRHSAHFCALGLCFRHLTMTGDLGPLARKPRGILQPSQQGVLVSQPKSQSWAENDRVTEAQNLRILALGARRGHWLLTAMDSRGC